MSKKEKKKGAFQRPKGNKKKWFPQEQWKLVRKKKVFALVTSTGKIFTVLIPTPWNNDVWAPALECMPEKMGWIMTALRESIVKLNDSVPMSIEDGADKPTIVFAKDEGDLVSMVAMSTQMQISIKYDGDIPEGVPGEIKKGMLIVKINQ